MDIQRFNALCEAHGGDLRLWPASERDAAAVLAARDPAAAASLAEAGLLDALLHAAPAAVPSHALRERVLAAAPRPRASAMRRLDWVFKAGLGAGLAAAGVAGVLVGSAMTSADGPGLAAVAALDASPEATAFGGAPDLQEG
jgi:anti-sigma factor RsiW